MEQAGDHGHTGLDGAEVAVPSVAEDPVGHRAVRGTGDDVDGMNIAIAFESDPVLFHLAASDLLDLLGGDLNLLDKQPTQLCHDRLL